MVSIEGYIHSCVKYCVIRFVTKAYDEDSKVVRDTLKQDEDSSKEISLFDTIADSKDGYSDMVFDLESICKACENERYSYGPDIFMIWFVRFQTLLLNKSDKYNDILSVLGISKREISLIQKNIEVDSLMFNIAKAATLIPMEEAASIIEKYVYGADRIKQAIETA